jgi:peptide deformylase
MAILKVARMGNPVLRLKARTLTAREIRSPRIRKLIADMTETMREYGGVGLAGPQVHEPVRLALVEFDEENPRYSTGAARGLTVFVNPRVRVLDRKTQPYWEGCLSVPGMRGLVDRPRKIRVDYLDERARKRTLVAEGFLATVLQHEFDHLDGVLYLDRLKDPRKFAFSEEYQRYWAETAPDAGE